MTLHFLSVGRPHTALFSKPSSSSEKLYDTPATLIFSPVRLFLYLSRSLTLPFSLLTNRAAKPFPSMRSRKVRRRLRRARTFSTISLLFTTCLLLYLLYRPALSALSSAQGFPPDVPGLSASPALVVAVVPQLLSAQPLARSGSRARKRIKKTLRLTHLVTRSHHHPSLLGSWFPTELDKMAASAY